MPLFAESGGYRLAEHLRRIWQQPALGYGIAFTAFALATGARWAFHSSFTSPLPWLPPYPAAGQRESWSPFCPRLPGQSQQSKSVPTTADFPWVLTATCDTCASWLALA